MSAFFWPLALACAIAAAICLVALFASRATAERETSHLLRQECQALSIRLDDQGSIYRDLSHELQLARAEAREEAERHRAIHAQAYAEHIGTMQRQLSEVITLTHKQMESGRRATDERLAHLSGSLTDQLGAHNKVILAVQGQLGALGEAAKGMHALGKDIASLQDILQAPKLRGNLGELLLAEILRQVLPRESFDLQHRFAGDDQGGEVIVDAVIHLGDRLVPIDSKFPLESFRRLLGANQQEHDAYKRQRRAFLEVVRGHIDAVAKKYIRPDKGTYEFALAYLPAENVYYEAVVRDAEIDGSLSIVSYAASRGVICVSPSTLYAYLLTVAYGLRGLHIERQAEAIRGQLAGFNKKFTSFYQALEKTARHLDLAHRSHDDALKRGSKLNDQMGKITGSVVDLDNETDAQIDAPRIAANTTNALSQGAEREEERPVT